MAAPERLTVRTILDDVFAGRPVYMATPTNVHLVESMAFPCVEGHPVLRADGWARILTEETRRFFGRDPQALREEHINSRFPEGWGLPFFQAGRV
jgi:hypothetical protein